MGNEKLESEHVAFSKFIVNFLNSAQIRVRYRRRGSDLRRITRFVHQLARQIEKMAPAVDREAFPVNTEYPWEQDGELVIPCGYQFPELKLLRSPDGLSFLRIVGLAITEFAEIHLR